MQNLCLLPDDEPCAPDHGSGRRGTEPGFPHETGGQTAYQVSEQAGRVAGKLIETIAAGEREHIRPSFQRGRILGGGWRLRARGQKDNC